jgi:sporulation protein YunB
LSSDVINDAVNATLDKLDYTYDDLSKIVYSTDGEVKAIETDSIKINYLKSEITKAVENEISKIYDNEIEIPLGSFTDITVLSNWGPNISMNFNLTGSFTAEIVSTLEQSGINQSIHHIKLLLTSNIMTTTLDYSGKITFTTDFEIAQSVIVGEIPSSYGNLYRTY